MAKGLHFHRTKGHQIAIPLDLPGTATLGLSSAHQSCRSGMSRLTPDLAAGAPAEGRNTWSSTSEAISSSSLTRSRSLKSTRPTSPIRSIPMPRRFTAPGGRPGWLGSHLHPQHRAAHRRRIRTITCCPARRSGAPRTSSSPNLLDPVFRPADGTLFDPDGPGPAPAIPTAANYNPSNNPNSLVFNSSLRTISNLIVDQTLGNPAAILKGLQVGGVAEASLANVAAGAGHLRRLQARVGRRVSGPRRDAERQGGGERAQRRQIR